jgi:hypothetical protein
MQSGRRARQPAPPTTSWAVPKLSLLDLLPGDTTERTGGGGPTTAEGLNLS